MAVLTPLKIADFLPATLTAPGLTEAQFLKLCDEFPDDLLEYTAEGEVIIMPPTDFESGRRVADLLVQLALWARVQGAGSVSGPDTGFFLPNGARRSPDAATVAGEGPVTGFVLDLRLIFS